jgi:hypothetical protein
VLALDIASSSGFAFGVEGEVIQYGKYTPDTDKPIGKRLLDFSKWLSRLLNRLPATPDIVVIELPYLANGRTKNVLTFSVLTKYIGIAQREVWRVLQTDCVFMTSREVKTKLRLPSVKSHPERKKQMIRRVNKLLGLDLQYVSGRSRKAKRSDDDMADAIGLLLAYWIKEGTIDIGDIDE